MAQILEKAPSILVNKFIVNLSPILSQMGLWFVVA